MLDNSGLEGFKVKQCKRFKDWLLTLINFSAIINSMFKLPKTPNGFAPIIIIIAVVLVALIGGGGYYFTVVANKPARVKSSVGVIQPLFLDYHRSIKKITEHLQDDTSGADTGKLEREIQKGEDLIKEAENNLTSLKPQVEKVNTNDIPDYKKKLEDYLNKSQEIISLEKQSVRIGKGTLDPLKDLEKMVVEVSGVANYMYSDPATYVKKLGDAIKTEDSVISRVEKVDATGDYKESFDLQIKSLKLLRELYTDMKNAVEKRDDTGLVTAQQKFAKEGDSLQKDSTRAEDKVKDKIKDLNSNLDNLKEDIERIQGDLKSQFKF